MRIQDVHVGETYRPRHRPATAGPWFTIGCRTLDRFEQQRAYLFGAGIPAAFLPSAREFGRSDLL